MFNKILWFIQELIDRAGLLNVLFALVGNIVVIKLFIQYAREDDFYNKCWERFPTWLKRFLTWLRYTWVISTLFTIFDTLRSWYLVLVDFIKPYALEFLSLLAFSGGWKSVKLYLFLFGLIVILFG